MHIYPAADIKRWDEYTIRHEPITAIDLMERAAKQLSIWIINQYPPPASLVFMCGKGNNGGDGLALARILSAYPYTITLYQLAQGAESESAAINRERLAALSLKINSVQSVSDFPTLQEEDVVIDALFGSGLNRPLEGIVAQLVLHINRHAQRVVSIDLPSGLLSDVHVPGAVIMRSTHTLTLHCVKPALLMPESGDHIGHWEVIPIGLHDDFVKKFPSPYQWIRADEVEHWQPVFGKHVHKGQRGHALLFAGSLPMMGAAIMCTSACTHSGAGLVTTATEQAAWHLIQLTNPMAMCALPGMAIRSSWLEEKKVKAIGIGPGLHYDEAMLEHLHAALSTSLPVVVDASALQGLPAVHTALKDRKAPTVLTPHTGEFDRITQPHTDSYTRLETAIELAKQWEVIIVLKGAYTRVICPSGKVYFNSSGNPGMAKGGTGDVLCGLLTGMLAQGMNAKHAACSAVYIHGVAGDLAAASISQHAMVPTDIISHIQQAFAKTNWN